MDRRSEGMIDREEFTEMYYGRMKVGKILRAIEAVENHLEDGIVSGGNNVRLEIS
jgi:hypothetical protein